MKLHAPDRKILVPDSHDFPFLGFRRDLQAGGNGLSLDDERVVTGRGKRIGHVLEEILAVMPDGGGLAMHHAIVHHHLRSERMPDALVPEADSEKGDERPERPDDVVGKAGFPGRTGPR